MSESDDKINQLQTRLEKMVEYQDYFYREINLIRDEIKSLKQSSPGIKAKAEEKSQTPVEVKVHPRPTAQAVDEKENYQQQETRRQPNFTRPPHQPLIKSKSSLEEFVGRNLISLVGIIITILGVGIGAKYAIDRDLISPLTRIILGYLFAAGMLGVAIWLKKKYLNFSAVLLSGSLAMLYFLTYFSYSFYAFIPQRIAFLMMLFFTAFTVAAAINYNRQVIAHIGLVGAYAVPFLLSENSGRADILFSYITIINFGILAVSVKKFWKPLFYSSFIFTWLIYAAWYFSRFRADEHFILAFGFAFTFFLTFYLTFLSYKLISKEEFNAEIVVLVFVNSFIFYGFGYSIIESREGFERFLGLFTLLNALLNVLFAVVIYRYKLGDRKNLYLAVALAVTFITIAVPVQFSGNRVTLLWTTETAILFWIGRVKQISLYESLSYPLMILASISLLNDWQNAFNNETILTPILNQNFLTSILFAAAFGFITFISRDNKYQPAVKNLEPLINFALPTIFLFALYNTFRIEIGNYFHAVIMNSAVEILPRGEFNEAAYRKDANLQSLNGVWQINYSMLFLTLLSFANIKKVRSYALGFVNLGLNWLILFAFLTAGLYLLSELRESYLMQTNAEFSPPGILSVFVRYISYAFVAALLYAGYEYTKQEFLSDKASTFALNFSFDFVLYVALLWLASSELINLMNIFGYNNSDKLGLSILWGFYSLMLIILGIVKKKTYLRIGAIALFAVTLIKLFFYDIAELNTISKTIVFVSLGVFLLIISFLYNKYKDLIFDKDGNETAVS